MDQNKQMRIVRIVVASPSDVQPERDRLPGVLDELNHSIAADRHLRLDLCRWETDAHPGFHSDGPQGLIDSTLRIEDCDVLIGIFWKRFGTPVRDADSGTEHEFRQAYDSWKLNKRPQIMMYFKEHAYTPISKAESDQWGKVLGFRETFPAEALWWRYTTENEFESLVRRHLTNFIRGQFPIAEAQGPESSGNPGDQPSRGNATAGSPRGLKASSAAPAFTAGIEAGVYGDGSIWAACHSLQGNTISPLGALLYISVFNQQSVPAMVKSYTVEFQSGEGNLVLLTQVPMDSVSLYLVQQGRLETANRIDFSDNLLETKARKSAITPYGILRGWAPFDVPETFVIPRPPVISYRITVRGYNGAEGTCTAAVEPGGGIITAKRGPFGRPSPESASFAINNRCTDLSSHHVLPFSRLMR